jgi:hypothetical protein
VDRESNISGLRCRWVDESQPQITSTLRSCHGGGTPLIDFIEERLTASGVRIGLIFEIEDAGVGVPVLGRKKSDECKGCENPPQCWHECLLDWHF